MSWSAPTDNGGSAVTSYDARYIRSDAADKADDNWTERDGIWTSGVLRYTVDSLTNGVGYDVQVRAVNVAGEGPWSAAASATPQTVTDAPAIDLITPGDGALAVSWSAPSDTGGSAITSYDVRHIRSDALDKADDSWTVRDSIWTSGALEYTLSGLTNGVGYDVQVRAVNDAGDGPWSATATDTPRTTPGAPTIDVITPGNYALSITWSAPAEDGGSAITSYDLRYIRSDATDKADDNWTVREDIWSSGLLQYGLNESTGFNLEQRGPVRGAGQGGQRRRQWVLVGQRDRHAAEPVPTGHRTRRARVPPGDAGRRQSVHCLVRAGRRRRGGRHVLRPAIHLKRRGRTNRTPTGRSRRMSGARGPSSTASTA